MYNETQSTMKTLIMQMLPARFKQYIRKMLRCPEQDIRFHNLSELGFSPRAAIDVGAFRGQWSRSFKAIFPHCAILAIEPQISMQKYLSELQTEYSDFTAHTALLGSSSNSVLFVEEASNSRVIKPEDRYLFNEYTVQERTLIPLDTLLESIEFTSADYLKIDAQGYELEILKGAERTLKSTEIVQLEVSVIQIGPCPIFLEVLQFMNDAGFQFYDLFSLNYRPLDDALWQFDCLFVKHGSVMISSNCWI